MSHISDTETNGPSETLEKYQHAKQRVFETLEWLRKNLNKHQNEVLNELLESVETCTEMEWNGAFQTGYDMGEMTAKEDVGIE